MTKDGPDTASVGQTITYSFVITNQSSADSPNLVLDSVTDVGNGWSGLGDLTAVAAAAGCGTLAPSASCNFTVEYTIQVGDPSPLENTVTVLDHPDGFPNEVTDDDSHSLVLPTEGCTPGFWQGGAGSQLWNESPDPDWTAAGGIGDPPFTHDTVFGDFFTPSNDPSVDDLTMFELVSMGGGGNDIQKAARSLVAAYLNASFGLNYPLSTAQLEAAWEDAVNNGTFLELHIQLDAFNNLGCPIG